MSYSKSKKGVSPLIATVLLIAFAVALGAVVMNWGRSYVEATAEDVEKSANHQTDCSTKVSLKFSEDAGIPIIEYNETDGKLIFVMTNTGNVQLEDARVSIYGANYDIETFDLLSIYSGKFPILPGYPNKFNLTFATTGAINKIEIVPSIKSSGSASSSFCSDDSLVGETINSFT